MNIYYDELLVISVKLTCGLISLQLHYFSCYKFKTVSPGRVLQLARYNLNIYYVRDHPFKTVAFFRGEGFGFG